MNSLLDALFSFDGYAQLLPLMAAPLAAGAVLALVGGLVGVFVMARDSAFAVHGISELSFAGASFALLVGLDVVAGSIFGSIAAALIIGLVGEGARKGNSAIGVLMPAGLGLGILFLSLHPGRTSNKFSLLTGQIVAVDSTQLGWMAGLGVFVLAALGLMWRPLMFATADPEVAAARGIPVRTLGLAFMVVLGVAVSMAVHMVGALLVMSLLVTPAAAALAVASSPSRVASLSVLFALVSMVGGMLLALGSRIPVSPYVTTISFLIYLGCWGIRRIRSR